MSGTIRSRMEARKAAHKPCTVFDKSQVGYQMCDRCRNQPWPCPDWVAADDTLTDLNNAELRDVWIEGTNDYRRFCLIPDPDSQ